MSRDPFELPLRLLMAFREIVDEVHADLAERGFSDLRPTHGFVLLAIGPNGSTAAELGRRLGVSKQAAGKHIDATRRLGLVDLGSDPHDARRKVVRRSARGDEMIMRAAESFGRIRRRWAETLGEERMRDLETCLRTMTPAQYGGVDVPGWFGTG